MLHPKRPPIGLMYALQSNGCSVAEISKETGWPRNRIRMELADVDAKIRRMADARFVGPDNTIDWSSYRSDISLLWSSTAIEAAARRKNRGEADAEDLRALEVAEKMMRPDAFSRTVKNWAPSSSSRRAARGDTAISLLLEAPRACVLFPERPDLHCDACWPCRVDKFLRDAGLRR